MVWPPWWPSGIPPTELLQGTASSPWATKWILEDWRTMCPIPSFKWKHQRIDRFRHIFVYCREVSANLFSKQQHCFRSIKNKNVFIQKQQCLKATLFLWGETPQISMFFFCLGGMAFHPQKSHLAEIGGRKPKAAPKPPDSPLHWVLRWGENSQTAKLRCRFFGVEKNPSFRSWKRLRVYQTPWKMMGQEGRRSFPSLPFWVSANFQGLC